MKLTIDKNILLESLNNVTKAISNKSVIPILNGIRFELNNEGLYLLASDSELTIQSFIPKNAIKSIESTGVIIIQSKYITEIIRKMPADYINIEIVDGTKISIYCENNRYDLNCLNPADYPNIKLEENKNPLNISSDVFKSIIKETVFAISTQESRPLLTGLNLKINGNVLECVATDSYRLAKKTIILDVNYKDEVNIVIPGKNLLELDKILTTDNDIETHIFNNKILFKYKNILFQTNLLSGTYPNTNSLIPNEFNIIINTNINNYFDAIDRAALLTQSKERNIVKMKLNKDKLIITSFSLEIGKVEEVINLSDVNEHEIEISFSAKYMLEALRTFKEDDLLIMLNSENKPIVIKTVKDETLIQLLLPIQTY